ncbi:MAG TPA: ABC transporter permease [Baekduia sp.]|nr:ABC transporter permease [Baekduia sp.]
MSTLDTPRVRTAPAPAPVRKVTAEEILRGTQGFTRIQNAGGMGALLVTSFRLALTPPFSWWKGAIVDGSLMLRRCIMPLLVSSSVFVVGFGFFVLGGITEVLGASDREGGAVIIGLLREMAIWLTGMIFAGVAGSAIAADLGARKVREELDALSVLGVDKTRVLVVPKVMAATLICPVLGFVSILGIEVVNFALAPSQFGWSPGVLFASSLGSLTAPDIWGALIRYLIIGAMVGVVGCYKGLTCDAGTEGVGRAVNQTIVITFFGVWMLDAFFNLAYLSLFPEAQVSFKG